MRKVLFEGAGGWLAAKVMARMNVAAEREAVARLAPPAGARILVVGFGAGVGVELLLERPVSFVLGVDPSAVMNRLAAKRSALAVAGGRLKLWEGIGEDLPLEEGPFDGAIAVHTLQMCQPFPATARRLAQAMKTGSKVVSLTHGWAARKEYGSVDRFTETVAGSLKDAGFAAVECGFGDAERGTVIRIEAVR